MSIATEFMRVVNHDGPVCLVCLDRIPDDAYEGEDGYCDKHKPAPVCRLCDDPLNKARAENGFILCGPCDEAENGCDDYWEDDSLEEE